MELELFICQCLPALCFQLHLTAIAGDEHTTQFGLGDVANEADALYLAHLLVVGEGHGEQQLVVFATIEGAGGDVHVELFGHHGGLVVERDVLFIHAAAGAALLADVHEL